MKTLNDIPDVKGKRVLLRLDLNAPVENGMVTDDFRIRASLPTLEWLRERGARTVIVSHMEGKGGDSLKPAFEALSALLGPQVSVKFVGDCVGEEVSTATAALGDGEFLVLENLRAHAGEKKNDPDFAAQLASLGDFYINEAFSASHREHASIVGVPRLMPGRAFAGLLLEKEVRELSSAFNPPHPFIFILGGAKFDTKLPLMEKFLNIADTIFVGGALANDCFKARGLNVGQSVVSSGEFDLSAIARNPKVMLPTDVVVERAGARATVRPEDVQDEDRIWDAGPETVAALGEIVRSAKFILWNGPLGNFEIGYTEGTEALAKIIAEAGSARGAAGADSENDLRSIIGGGDTIASIGNLGLDNKFSFLSTGGGAMLDFLANGTLPGVRVLG